MADSYARIVLHTTFSVKYRNPHITPQIEGTVKAQLSHHLQRLGARVLALECVPDHVHIVHTLPRTVAVATLLNEIKKWSSRVVNRDYDLDYHFKWQTGYATFSADYRNLERLIQYVRNQKQHHGYVESDTATLTFVEEYSRQLLAYGFEIHPYYTFPVAPLDDAA